MLINGITNVNLPISASIAANVESFAQAGSIVELHLATVRFINLASDEDIFPFKLSTDPIGGHSPS